MARKDYAALNTNWTVLFPSTVCIQ